MKKILIISAFTNPFLDNNNRVLGIASIFTKKGWNVEIITADFSHTYKRYYNSFTTNSTPLFNTYFVHVTSYKTNISIKRIISHLVFAFRIYFLIKRKVQQYDLFYSTTPTNLAPFLVNKLAVTHKIPHIVDVIDIWPESFFVLTRRLRFIAKIFTYPWLRISHSLYKEASLLIAASKKYAKFGQEFRKDTVHSYLLGIDTDKISSLISTSLVDIPLKQDNEVWIVYGGTLGKSYDFEVIIQSLIELKKEGLQYRFFFIGGGEMEEYIKSEIRKYDIEALVTGRLNYGDYLKWLNNCDIAINAFKVGTLVAQSYKFNDYLAAGCCVVNNLTGETAELIDTYKIGLNFDYKNQNLVTVLKYLLTNPEILKSYRRNVYNMIEKELSKERIMNKLYQDIVESLNLNKRK